MKNTILGIISMLFISSQAYGSSYFIHCSNATGNISDVSGHANRTDVKVYNRETRKFESIQINRAFIEVEKELQTLAKTNSNANCGFGSSTRTYIVKGILKIKDNSDASEEIKEQYDGAKDFFICKEEISWMGPGCGDND